MDILENNSKKKKSTKKIICNSIIKYLAMFIRKCASTDFDDFLKKRNEQINKLNFIESNETKVFETMNLVKNEFTNLKNKEEELCEILEELEIEFFKIEEKFQNEELDFFKIRELFKRKKSICTCKTKEKKRRINE